MADVLLAIEANDIVVDHPTESRDDIRVMEHFFQKQQMLRTVATSIHHSCPVELTSRVPVG